jgi:hypothetical protein
MNLAKLCQAFGGSGSLSPLSAITLANRVVRGKASTAGSRASENRPAVANPVRGRARGYEHGRLVAAIFKQCASPKVPASDIKPVPRQAYVAANDSHLEGLSLRSRL